MVPTYTMTNAKIIRIIVERTMFLDHVSQPILANVRFRDKTHVVLNILRYFCAQESKICLYFSTDHN